MSSFLGDPLFADRLPFLEEARRLHSQFPLCDGHNDLPWCLNRMEPVGPSGLNELDLERNHVGLGKAGPAHGCLHTDLVRLAQGGVGWQFWSVFTPVTASGPIAVQMTLEQIDIVKRLVAKYSTRLEMAYCADDVDRIFKSGKIASMCGMEGGHQINNSMGTLRMMYELGVRYMTLTHNGGPGWADPALDMNGRFLPEAPLGGLTEFGKAIVLEMNRIGMLVDCSHVHAVTMRAALVVSQAPIIFSHSCSRAVCDHPRDVPDDVLRSLVENGGVVMVTFVSSFVAGEFWVRGGAVGATVIEVADHIDHIRNVAGINHIGIGGDYDGCKSLARGLEDVSCYTTLTAELIFRGYSHEDIGKILSGNLFRVLRAAEGVSVHMKSEGVLPSELSPASFAKGDNDTNNDIDKRSSGQN